MKSDTQGKASVRPVLGLPQTKPDSDSFAFLRVITGLGVVSPVGNDVKSNWEALLEGRSGIGPITRFDPSRVDTKIAAEVKNFDAAQFVSKKKLKEISRFIGFALPTRHAPTGAPMKSTRRPCRDRPARSSSRSGGSLSPPR